MNVFLSSTCYEYEERRDLLFEVVTQVGFNPLFSDKPNFARKKGMHSHDVCLENIKQADIFVLVIQKRYGQIYLGVKDEYKEISITHAEFREAVKLGKSILAFTEKDIPLQRHLFKINNSDPKVNILKVVFDFYNEVSKNGIDNWISDFNDNLECRDQLKNQLNNIINENLSQYGKEKRDQFLSINSKFSCQGTIELVSHWKIICNSWHHVKKIWKLTILNSSNQLLVMNDSLTLPIQYIDAKLEDFFFSINDGLNTMSMQYISAQIKEIGNPIHGKALIINLHSPIALHPGSLLTFEITFVHSDYFQGILDQKFNIGIINYLDYPGFRGLSILQRVCKEYYISKELTNNGIKILAIHPIPICDWSIKDDRYWIFGYSRIFEIGERMKIEILINS